MMGSNVTEGLKRRKDQDRSLDGVRIRHLSVQETGEGIHKRHKPLTQRHWEHLCAKAFTLSSFVTAFGRKASWTWI